VEHEQTQKDKPRKSLPVNMITFIVTLKYQSNTKILSVGIKYSVRELLLDANNYA